MEDACSIVFSGGSDTQVDGKKKKKGKSGSRPESKNSNKSVGRIEKMFPERSGSVEGREQELEALVADLVQQNEMLQAQQRLLSMLHNRYV